MKLKCLTTAALLYYSPAIFAGGADVFSNTEGKIITLHREGIHKTKYNNTKQIHKEADKLAKKSGATKQVSKSKL